MKNPDHQTRVDFLQIHAEFITWMTSIGFRHATKEEEKWNVNSFFKSKYEELMETLFGLEIMYHDLSRICICFIRSKNTHEIRLLGEGRAGKLQNLDKAKEEIEKFLELHNELIRQ